MDRDWWGRYVVQARREFAGELVCPLVNCHGVRQAKFDHGSNSGAGAISLAAHTGARRIVLVGYDCQLTGGRSHWHGDHPKGLGNAGSLPQWAAQFGSLARRLRGIEVINCSRETALTCFPRAALEDVL